MHCSSPWFISDVCKGFIGLLVACLFAWTLKVPLGLENDVERRGFMVSQDLRRSLHPMSWVVGKGEMSEHQRAQCVDHNLRWGHWIDLEGACHARVNSSLFVNHDPLGYLRWLNSFWFTIEGIMGKQCKNATWQYLDWLMGELAFHENKTNIYSHG